MTNPTTMNTSSALCVASKYNFPLKEPGFFQEKAHFSFGEECTRWDGNILLYWKAKKLSKNMRVMSKGFRGQLVEAPTN